MSRIRDLFRKIAYILTREQKIYSIGLVFMIIVNACFEVGGVSIIIPVIGILVSPEQLYESKFCELFPIIKTLQYRNTVIVIISAVILLYLIKNIYSGFFSWVRNKYACKIQREMSIAIMKSYMSRGYEFFLSKNFGELNRGVGQDTFGVYCVINNVCRLITDVLTISMIFVFLLITDWRLTTILGVLAISCVCFIYFIFRKRLGNVGVVQRENNAIVSQIVAQCIYGIKDVLVLRKQKECVKEYEIAKRQQQNNQIKASLGEELPAFIIEGMCVSGLMFAIGIRIVVGTGDTAQFISALAAIALGAFRILPYLGRISVEVNLIVQYYSSIEAVYANLQEARNYAKEHPEGDVELIQDQRVLANNTIGSFKELLELRGVSFRYDSLSEGSKNVLNSVSLSIKKGQAIAIIGASGSGKSTLVDILLGLLVPQQGGVYMDGDNINTIPDLWAKTVGYVSQTVFLNDTSVKRNVAFGEASSDIDEERVIEALERAELLDFVLSLPDGLETRVGDRGVRLSGGQRQRIAIARALYHRPEILVLDEATAALDNDTEAAVMSAIDSLHGQVTLIIVAHRLSTVRNCDIIYEVDNYSVVERSKADVLKGIE